MGTRNNSRRALAALAVVTALVIVGCPMEMDNALRASIEQAVEQAAHVATPVFSPTTGTYSSDQSVTISCETPDSVVFYTDDGTVPSTTSKQYDGALSVSGDGTVRTFKAIAVKGGLETSSIAEARIEIDYARVSTPQFSPLEGTYTSDQSVGISCDTDAATIRYTTDGSTPTPSSSQYSQPIPVTGSADGVVVTTVKAIAVKEQMNDSTVASGIYTIAYPQVSTPVLDPPSGTYYGAQSITISVTPPAASIRYTTDGSDPSTTDGTLYTDPVELSDDATIKAVGYGSGLRTSAMAEGSFIIDRAGGLDGTFGTGGIVTTAIGSSSDDGLAVAIQSDGMIVVAGYSYNGTDHDFALARYTSAGALDTTFDADGKVTTAIGSGHDRGDAVAIQADGKIVVAGYSSNGNGDWDFALARYTSAGVLDADFGTGGIVTTAIGSGDDYGTAVAIQSDDMIVVAGYSYNGTDEDFALARYSSAGVLDADFGTGGIVTTAIGSGHDWGLAVAIQSDGKIVVAGDSYNGNDNDFALARYTSTGALDGTFGTGGKVTTAIGSSDDYSRAVAIQADGMIVVAGYSYNGTDYDFALARYTSAGALDASFGTGGIVTTAIGSGHDWGRAVAIQSDGKIVVAGYSYSGTYNDFALARYSSAGALDADFGTGGIVTTAIGSSSDSGQAVAIQADGMIVVAGSSSSEFALARYWY